MDDLVTPRLIVRRPTRADAAEVHAILRDPRVVAHNPSDLVTDPHEIDALIGRWLDHWETHGFGNASVVERASGRLVGSCGLRHTTAKGQPALNLMYRFTPSCWGHGYATEAAGAVVAWAAGHLPEEVVLARIRPANTPSRRVALRIGLTRDPAWDDVGADGPDLAYTNRLP